MESLRLALPLSSMAIFSLSVTPCLTLAASVSTEAVVLSVPTPEEVVVSLETVRPEVEPPPEPRTMESSAPLLDVFQSTNLLETASGLVGILAEGTVKPVDAFWDECLGCGMG